MSTETIQNDQVVPDVPATVAAEQLVKKWLLARSFECKLTVLLLDTLGIEDHGTCGLADVVMASYERDILEAAENLDSEVGPEARQILGAILETLIWRGHY